MKKRALERLHLRNSFALLWNISNTERSLGEDKLVVSNQFENLREGLKNGEIKKCLITKPTVTT